MTKKGLPAEPGAGPGGRIIKQDVKKLSADNPLLTAAALAAVKAGKAAPDAGTGLGGRITMADIAAQDNAAIDAADAGNLAADILMGRTSGNKAGGEAKAELGFEMDITMPIGASEGALTETPVTDIRKAISDRMLASLSESAQYTLNASASAVQLQELRKQLKAAKEDPDLAKITMTDIILFAVSRVLPSFPYMNSHKDGNFITTYERIHLGFTADTPKGFMVPVIKNTQTLSLRQISAERKRLFDSCNNNTITPDELSGSTFTVSNLGNFGISSFTPVLNLPEAAILGVCNIELKPAENNDDTEDCVLAFEPHIGFSLTINHQVIDGVPAARFLKAFCDAIADINVLIIAG